MYKNERVKLRGFKQEDAIKLVELRDDFEAIQSFLGSPFPVNLQSESEWISNMYPAGLKKNIYLAIEEITTGNFVGYCVARNIDYINRNSSYGIIFHKDARGKGLFKDVNILFYSYLFNEINLHKIYAYVVVGNDRALNTYLKLGFKIEGEMKEQYFQKGKYIDVHFVSLLAKDFWKILNKG